MDKFPSYLTPENKEEFSNILHTKLLCDMRRRIHEHILQGDENSYFPITTHTESEIVQKLIPELESLGWKCKISYGWTALFIYSTENPPPSCW